MAMGPKPVGARGCVEPMMMIRKMAVSTTSTSSAATMLYPPGESAPYPLVANAPAEAESTTNPSRPPAIV
jgi:hypothetical protein